MSRSTKTVNGILIVSTEWRGLTPAFYPDGKIKHGLLDNATEIQGYPMCCEIAFYPSGKLKCGRLDHSITLNEIEYSGYIYLYENGKLQSSKLYKNSVIERYELLEDQYVDFDESGNLIAGCIAKPIQLAELIIPEKSFIRFDTKRVPFKSLTEVAYKSWEKGKFGASVNDVELGSWVNDQFGGAGGSCSFRDFLQGTLNETVQGDLGEYFSEIYEIVLRRHSQISDIRPEIKLVL